MSKNYCELCGKQILHQFIAVCDDCEDKSFSKVTKMKKKKRYDDEKR